MTNHHLTILKKCLEEDIAQLRAMSVSNETMVGLFEFLIEIKENIILIIDNEQPKQNHRKLEKIEFRKDNDRRLLLNLLKIEQDQLKTPHTLLHRRLTSLKLRTKLSLIITEYSVLIESLKSCVPHSGSLKINS